MRFATRTCCERTPTRGATSTPTTKETHTLHTLTLTHTPRRSGRAASRPYAASLTLTDSACTAMCFSFFAPAAVLLMEIPFDRGTPRPRMRIGEGFDPLEHTVKVSNGGNGRVLGFLGTISHDAARWLRDEKNPGALRRPVMIPADQKIGLDMPLGSEFAATHCISAAHELVAGGMVPSCTLLFICAIFFQV